MYGELDTRLNQETDVRTNQKAALLSPEGKGMEGIAAFGQFENGVGARKFSVLRHWSALFRMSQKDQQRS